MLVHERMSKHPITIAEDTPINHALKLIRDEKVRRLPVLNKKGELVGIVSEHSRDPLSCLQNNGG